MSAAPRPYSMPSRMVGVNGSLCHLSTGPVGTTSVWPAKHISGPLLPRRAHRLSTSPQRIFSSLKPSFSRRCADDFQAAVILRRERAAGDELLAQSSSVF